MLKNISFNILSLITNKLFDSIIIELILNNNKKIILVLYIELQTSIMFHLLCFSIYYFQLYLNMLIEK